MATWGGGECPLQWNYAQERFLISAYRAEQAKQPVYGFWAVPKWVKQGMGILARTEIDEQENKGK